MEDVSMTVKTLVALLVIGLVITFSVVSCERIDAGSEGIKVNLYGDNKGVDDVSLVTGMVFYNRFTTAIYEYPTYVKTIDYAPFKLNAKDGSVFIIDPTLTLQVKIGESPKIFKKYRKDLDSVIVTAIFNYVKESYRIQLNSFKSDEIISERAKVEIAVEDMLRKLLSDEGFNLLQLSSGLQYPESIVNAIDAKNTAVQEALRIENEIKVSEAKAKKLLIEAAAIAESNRLKASSLNDNIVAMEFINKWDGSTPLYGISPQLNKIIK